MFGIFSSYDDDDDADGDKDNASEAAVAVAAEAAAAAAAAAAAEAEAAASAKAELLLAIALSMCPMQSPFLALVLASSPADCSTADPMSPKRGDKRDLPVASAESPNRDDEGSQPPNFAPVRRRLIADTLLGSTIETVMAKAMAQDKPLPSSEIEDGFSLPLLSSNTASQTPGVGLGQILGGEPTCRQVRLL